MSIRTMVAENNMYQNAAAIINGKLNINALADGIAREPFSFYLKRYVSEKKKVEIDSITLEDIIKYYEENLSNYSLDIQNNILEWFPLERARRVTRDCLNYVEAKKEYPNRINNIIEQNKLEYEEYLTIKAVNRCERSNSQKERYRFLHNYFTNRFNNIKPREMSRNSLLKLFFYLDCTASEANTLLYELGEGGFYLKNRNELLTFWSLNQKDKFASYYINLDLLELERINSDIYFGNTKEYEKKITNDDGSMKQIDSEKIREIILSLENDLSVRATALNVYRNIISDVNSLYSEKFESEKYDNKKAELRRKIENNCHYEQNVEKLKELNKRLLSMESTAYRRIAHEFESRYNHSILSFQPNRIERILNGEIQNNIDRKDIITSLFLLFVLENYYDTESADIFDTIYSKEAISDFDDYSELAKDFEDLLDDALIAIDMQMANMTNPYDAFLFLCLATPSPIATFCECSDDYLDREEVNEI